MKNTYYILLFLLFVACSTNENNSIINEPDTTITKQLKTNNLQLLQGYWIDRNDRNHEVIITNHIWADMYADNLAAEYEIKLYDKPEYKGGKISVQGTYLNLQKDSNKIYYWQILSLDTNYLEIEFLDAQRPYSFKKKSLESKFDDCKCRVILKAKNKAMLRDIPDGDIVKKLTSDKEKFLIVASDSKWFQISNDRTGYENLWIEAKNLELLFTVKSEVPLYEEPLNDSPVRGYAYKEIELIKCCESYIFVKAKNKKGAEQFGWIKTQTADI